MRKINKYIEYELNIFRNECNFSDEELIYFNYKAKGWSNIRISTEMNASTATITRLGKSVSSKMNKVIELHPDKLF